MALRLATKGWNAAADALIEEGVRSGELMVHDGKDIDLKVADARKKRRKLVPRAIFLLNITKVGDYACRWATNLVVVDIPEGIESIGQSALMYYKSLTAVSFPTTLKSGVAAFANCYSLDNVDLLRTNLQQLGRAALTACSELKSMTIPDSLQILGDDVFCKYSKLVPPSIDIDDDINQYDVTSEVIAHLRSQQLLSATPPAPHANKFMLTNDFRKLLVGFVHDSTLMAFRCATKAWKVVVEEVIDEGVESGAMIVHDGKDIKMGYGDPRIERRKLETWVISF